MKKRLFAFLLSVIVCLPLFSCGKAIAPNTTGEEPPKTETETRAAVPPGVKYPHVADTLKAETVREFPTATDSMTPAERRDLVEAFFRLSMDFAWTPSKKFSFPMTDTDETTLKKNVVYSGFPYMIGGTGNVYRFLEFCDEETGVLDIDRAGKDFRVIGNVCSTGPFWAWARVVNSAEYGWCRNMTPAHGFIPVGSYVFPAGVTSYATSGNPTGDIIAANGNETMLASYAALDKADLLVHMKDGAAHVVMVAKKPAVVKTPDDAIDPEKSAVLVHDQGRRWHEVPLSDGSVSTTQTNKAREVTFMKLLEVGYLPFTFAELIGTDPVEELTVTLALPEAGVTPKELAATTLTSNYAISDVFLRVYDPSDKLVYEYVGRTRTSPFTAAEYPLKKVVYDSLNKFADGTCRVEIRLQSGHGENVLAYSGPLLSD